MRTHPVSTCLARAAMLLAMSASAGTTLFDFESDDDLAAWRLRSPGQDTLERAGEFATSGTSAARFRSPAWHDGMEPWPAFEAKPPVTDWTGYDRLVIDITNPEADRPYLSLHVTDGTTPFRQGLSHLFDLPGRGFLRAVVPLASFPAHIDRSDIVVDPLVMPIGAMASAGRSAFDLCRRLHDELRVNSTCGASNISFGLPNRHAMNSTFLAEGL